jgi:methionyl-tRNA formyltransferase
MMRVALLAPIDNSLYARLVAAELLEIEGVSLVGMVVRSHWNWRRFRSEFTRDGVRLLGKIHQKYILGDEGFDHSRNENLYSLAQRRNLQARSLKEIALEHKIPFLVAADHNQPSSVDFLKKCSPDLIVFTGGGLIRQDLLAIPKIGILNCHSGILPEYRGMDVVEWTAAEEKMEEVGFGATLHLMDSGVDSGPILIKRNIEIRAGDDFKSIRERLEVLMVELMIAGVRGLKDGNLIPIPQKPSDGRQYFVMHPRIKTYAEGQLKRMNIK